MFFKWIHLFTRPPKPLFPTLNDKLINSKLYLVELFLSSANFLLDVVVHEIRDVPHEQADIRQLKRKGLELLREGQVTFQVVLLWSLS